MGVMMKKLFYSAIFQSEEEGKFTVLFPDIKGRVTCGDSMEHAYEMATEALGLTLSYMEDNKEPIPRPSVPQDIVVQPNQFLVVIEFDMVAYKRKYNSKVVKKTLSIPEWLNEMALERGVNFSQVLQEALMLKLELPQQQKKI